MRKGSGCLSVIIIVVCVIICAVLVGKMLGNKDEAQPDSSAVTAPAETGQNGGGLVIEQNTDESNIVISVTQDKLRELIQNSLDEKFPIQLDELTLHENGTVETTGTLARENFMDFVKEHDSGLGKAELFLLQFAPEKLSFAADFEASYHPASGKMELTPTKLTVEKYSVPVSILPQALTDKFSLAVNGYAQTLGYEVKSIAIYDGYITLYIE